MTNLARLIADSATADPERPAIRLDHAVIPDGGLDHATLCVARRATREGSRPGHRVVEREVGCSTASRRQAATDGFSRARRHDHRGRRAVIDVPVPARRAVPRAGWSAAAPGTGQAGDDGPTGLGAPNGAGAL